MTSEPNLIQYPSTESTEALFTPGLLFPLPQHPDAPSPESFDQEFAELDLNLPYEQSDEFFTTFREFSPVVSPSTYSTTCVYGATSSHYSSDFTRSGYLIPSDIEGYSLTNGLHGTHDSIHSTVLSNGPPSIPPLHPSEAQFAFGTSVFGPNLFGFSPEDSSTAMQPPSTPLTVHHVTPDSEQMAPAQDRTFKCPHSPHSSKRKHSLKTHIKTYNKSKPFKCSTCGRRFNHKNDLHRQQKSNHTSKADVIV